MQFFLIKNLCFLRLEMESAAGTKRALAGASPPPHPGLSPRPTGPRRDSATRRGKPGRPSLLCHPRWPLLIPPDALSPFSSLFPSTPKSP